MVERAHIFVCKCVIKNMSPLIYGKLWGEISLLHMHPVSRWMKFQIRNTHTHSFMNLKTYSISVYLWLGIVAVNLHLAPHCIIWIIKVKPVLFKKVLTSVHWGTVPKVDALIPHSVLWPSFRRLSKSRWGLGPYFDGPATTNASRAVTIYFPDLEVGFTLCHRW